MIAKDRDNRKRDRKLSRRDFLKLNVITAGSLLAYSFNPPFQAETSQKPLAVTITLRYINHTRGPYGKKIIETTSGSLITITPNDIAGGHVDAKRVAVREEGFGKLVGFSDNGQFSFKAPAHDATYEIYGFNIRSRADYSLMDNDTFAGKGAKLFKGKRFLVARRQDWHNVSGPEYLWAKVFGQLNYALKHKWATYGHIKRKGKAKTADFSYGYGIPTDGIKTGGWHQGDRIFVRADMIPIAIFRIALAEAFELICQVDDIGGKSTHKNIWDSGLNMNRKGRDLFAYVFVKE